MPGTFLSPTLHAQAHFQAMCSQPPHLSHLHCKNGPSRQRRKAKQAEERAGKAENAADVRNETGTDKASEKGVNQTNDLIEEEVVDEVVIL